MFDLYPGDGSPAGGVLETQCQDRCSRQAGGPKALSAVWRCVMFSLRLSAHGRKSEVWCSAWGDCVSKRRQGACIHLMQVPQYIGFQISQAEVQIWALSLTYYSFDLKSVASFA